MIGFSLELPPWVLELTGDGNRAFPDVESRMDFAISLARANVEHRFGGPFGAAVFDLTTNKLIAPGINLVIPSKCSVAHAEIVAIILAQQKLGTHDLRTATPRGCELVTSLEPCAMCLGAIPWSGVRSVVCGARDEDARDIGFDEGSKPANWAETLRERGISVICNVAGERARAVLDEYLASGGKLY